MKRKLIAPVLASLFFASMAGTQLAPYAMADTQPQAHSAGGVTYLNGGIGKEEAAAMRHVANQYDVRMVLAEKKDGEFITGAKVSVLDQKGKQVLHVASAGPLLYIKLPSGKYQVRAEFNGRRQEQKLVVADHRPVDLYFYWTGDVKRG